MDLLLAAQPHDSAVTYVAHAWEKSTQAIRDCKHRMLANPNSSTDRKKRSDTGKTLIQSQAKRKSVYTPKYVFSKWYR